MLITELLPYGKTKYKVYIDDEFAFVLSIREVRMYGLEVEKEVSEVQYNEIIEETILPRAKLKAMDLLKRMDRTEHELQVKLQSSGFSEQMCKEAIAYVKQFNYVNDDRFAANYIHSRKTGKSKKMIQMELHRKGVDKTSIEHALSEAYEDTTEEDAIRREVRKKCRKLDDISFEKRMKLSSALYRKGYSYDAIQSVLNDLSFLEEPY